MAKKASRKKSAAAKKKRTPKKKAASRGKKAAETRKRKGAGRKAAVTPKRKAAGRKAVATKKAKKAATGRKPTQGETLREASDLAREALAAFDAGRLSKVRRRVMQLAEMLSDSAK